MVDIIVQLVNYGEQFVCKYILLVSSTGDDTEFQNSVSSSLIISRSITVAPSAIYMEVH